MRRGRKTDGQAREQERKGDHGWMDGQTDRILDGWEDERMSSKLKKDVAQ